jgi:aminoglycoside phosphotransferase (APT) family kinase protein
VCAAANVLLARHRLEPIEALELLPRDSANPTYLSVGPARRYAIKLTQRHPDSLAQQLRIANGIRAASRLPIPEHLCCAAPGDPLPLMIMEWLPGESLWHFFQRPQDAAREVVHAWGRCIAEFHRTRLPLDLAPDVAPDPEGWRGFAGWIRAILMAPRSAAESASGWSEDDARAFATHATPRLASLERPARPGLVKADQDFRDTLARVEPAAHISGLLDWERVSTADTLQEIANLRARMATLGVDALWPSFRAGYESRAEALREGDASFELYVLARTRLAFPRSAGARDFARAILAGHSPLEAP